MMDVPSPVDARSAEGVRESQILCLLAPVVLTEQDLDDGTALTELVREFRAAHPQAPASDVDAIERAFALASKAHAGQRRRSGEPYFVHPVRVASTLTQLGLDAVSIAAGLLHDAVEDSELTVFDVHERFGLEVANIVDGVTKLGKVPYLSKQEQQAESFRKMLLAMSEDIRVLIVKLGDRLDNMRTLDSMPGDKRERISRETMQIYAPLAGRLGIEWLRRELQDLSFRHLEPSLYASTRSDLDRFLRQRPGIIAGVISALQGMYSGQPLASPAGESDLDPPGPWPRDALGPVQVRVTMRPAYRVFRRLESTSRPPDQLSDVATFQVVTRDRATCYAALGQLHALMQPVPGRFRDYIALPRPNQYQGLHTTVIDSRGQRLEVQIRSQRMHAMAERGIISQWDRLRPQSDGSRRTPRRMRWLGQLMDWQSDVSDPQEFIEAVKADLFADEVYVFTPKGDIFTFPKGATPIDFAFSIHTDVGMKCSGARVNGHLVPLRYRLRQGDTVEILTNPTVGPREEWLKMCVSSRARAKIKQYLRQRERERLRSLGRSLLEQELKAHDSTLSTLDAGELYRLTEPLGLPRDAKGDEGVFESIGNGHVTARAVTERLLGPQPDPSDKNLFTRMLRKMSLRSAPKGREITLGRPETPMIVSKDLVEGPDALVTLSPCCSPVPGDPLVGFFEVGRGIVAHVEGCPGVLQQVAQQRVHLAWEDGLDLEGAVTIEVRTANSVGLLAKMSRVFSQSGVNIMQANCRSAAEGDRAVNTFNARVSNLAQLLRLMVGLKAIDGVVGVERVFTP